MPTSAETDAAAPRSGALEDAETFNPARHLSAVGAPIRNDPVYLELACSCGAIRKQCDPPAYLVRTVQTWIAQHGGPGHGPVSMAEAVEEREARREAAHRAAGRAEDYQPADTSGHSTEVRAWPDLSTAGSGNTEGE